jgi:hypothetical protein
MAMDNGVAKTLPQDIAARKAVRAKILVRIMRHFS